MRKINDTELATMLESGKSKKECADYFGVSKSAITQRVKKLKAYASFNKLTEKKKEFVLAKVEGKTNMEAVKASYDVTTNESAKALATQLMQDPDVTLAIRDLMAQEGIPRRHRVKRLKDIIDCADMSAVGKGLDMSFKLTGEYAPEKFEEIIDYRSLNLSGTVRELTELLAQRKAQQAQQGDVKDIEKS
jgi:phage terminase small subunit